MILETSVFDNFIDFITNAAKQIGFNWIAVIAFMLLLITIIVSFVWTMFSIDVKTSKAVQQVNLYLEKNPYINEENLVEFNKLMKSSIVFKKHTRILFHIFVCFFPWES